MTIFFFFTIPFLDLMLSGEEIGFNALYFSIGYSYPRENVPELKGIKAVYQVRVETWFGWHTGGVCLQGFLPASLQLCRQKVPSAWSQTPPRAKGTREYQSPSSGTNEALHLPHSL